MGNLEKTSGNKRATQAVPLPTVYSFDYWTERHGGMRSYVELGKRTVWDALKHDKEFFKQKLYEVKVQYTDNGYMGGYTRPGCLAYRTELHWAKTKAEASKYGEVIRQVYPELPQQRVSKPKAKKGV